MGVGSVIGRGMQGSWVGDSRGGGGVFVFQAEGGIRNSPGTGVQTCALPICGFRRNSNVSKNTKGCIYM